MWRKTREAASFLLSLSCIIFLLSLRTRKTKEISICLWIDLLIAAPRSVIFSCISHKNWPTVPGKNGTLSTLRHINFRIFLILTNLLGFICTAGKLELGSTFLYLKGLYPGLDSKGGWVNNRLERCGVEEGCGKWVKFISFIYQKARRLASCCDIEIVWKGMSSTSPCSYVN